MDRFTGQRWPDQSTHSILDPQNAQPIARCKQCGLEIYPGEGIYTDTPNAPDDTGAVTLHKECLLDWVVELPTSTITEAFGFHTLTAD